MAKMVFKNLYEFIECIKVRPFMYIGSNSLTVLTNVISGYNTACAVNDVDEHLSPSFERFEDFVNRYYQKEKSSAHWSSIILAENYGDESVALDEFFKLFGLFRNEDLPILTNKIIFQIIQKVINDSQFLASIGDDSITEHLKKLPGELENSQTYHHYNSVFYDIAKMAKYNAQLSNAITEIAGSNGWLKVLD